MNSQLPPTYVENFHNVEAVKKMPYTAYGKTGMYFSAFSLGGVPFSGTLYGTCEKEEALKTVEHAVKSGVNLIDTAPYYGQGKSEKFLGEALVNIPREAYYLGTKVGRYEMDFENMFDFSAKKVQSSFENSLKLLRVNYVDLIQVHDVEFCSNPEIIIEETLPAVEEFVVQGQAKFIGITGYSLSALKYILDRSKVKISSILTYSRNTLFDHSLEQYIDHFIDNSLGVISAAPVAMRLLTNQEPPTWHPGSQKLLNLCKQARDLCKSNDVELARLAIHASVTNIPREKIPTSLVGVFTRKELEQNMDLVINGLNEKEKVIYKEVEKIFSNIDSCDTNWEGVEVKRYRESLKQSS